MKFLLMFDGTLMVGFEPHEVEEQIEFLGDIDATSDDDASIVEALLMQIREQDRRLQ